MLKRSERTGKGGESSAQTNHLNTSPTPNETERSRFLGVFGFRSTSRSPSPRPPSSSSPEASSGSPKLTPGEGKTVFVAGPARQDEQHRSKIEQDPNAVQQQLQQAPLYGPGLKGAGRDLWAKAYDQLPDELKQHLPVVVNKLQTLKDMLRAANDAKEANIANRLKFKWGDKEINMQEIADRLVGWITKFKEIGDIAVQYDPVHAALPWAGVRLILLVSSTLDTLLYKSHLLTFTA